jgi:type II pantothenate kinase
LEILAKESINLDSENKTAQLSKKILGVDIGQTLTKFAYIHDNDIILHLQSTKDNIDNILGQIISEEKIKVVHFTGGKAYAFYKIYDKRIETTILDEFNANINGVDFLYKLRKKREPLSSLIVTVGTGTSIVLKNASFEHLGGSAMGGGMFMGLMKLIYGLNDYKKIIQLANKGNRYNIDLKVSDIYAEDDPRIEDFFRAFTASSLGKINNIQNLVDVRKEDIIHSILGIIAENIGLIATLFASLHKVNEIIFCGGLLIDNKILKNLLKLIVKSKGINAVFLKNSEYAGALGALIS